VTRSEVTIHTFQRPKTLGLAITLLGYFADDRHDDGGSNHLRHAGQFTLHYTSQHSRRQVIFVSKNVIIPAVHKTSRRFYLSSEMLSRTFRRNSTSFVSSFATFTFLLTLSYLPVPDQFIRGNNLRKTRNYPLRRKLRIINKTQPSHGFIPVSLYENANTLRRCFHGMCLAVEAQTLLGRIGIKAKAVPLHAMKALGGRGGIAPTHSRPRH